MLGISISPKAILDRMGVQADSELVELATIFWMRLSDAPDKKAFMKDALRKALVKDGR